MIDKFYYRVVRRLITRKDELNQRSGGLWPRLVRQAALATDIPETGKLVELGCGEGLLLADLADAYPRAGIFGIDISDDHLDQAKTRLTGNLNVRLFPGDALKTDFEADHFDRCFCINVVLNLPGAAALEALIAEAHRILKPGGLFVFDIRNSWSPIIRMQYTFVRFYDPGITVPLRSYTTGTVTGMLARHGFALRERQNIGFPKNFMAPAVLITGEKI
jgi:SAM-dependent methyltransferase